MFQIVNLSLPHHKGDAPLPLCAGALGVAPPLQQLPVYAKGAARLVCPQWGMPSLSALVCKALWTAGASTLLAFTRYVEAGGRVRGPVKRMKPQLARPCTCSSTRLAGLVLRSSMVLRNSTVGQQV